MTVLSETVGEMTLLAQATQAVATPTIEWLYLAPIIILSLGGILLITLTSIAPGARGNHIPTLFTVACGMTGLVFLPLMAGRLNDLVSDGAASGIAARPAAGLVSSALVVDHFTLWITGLICVAVILVALVLDGYLAREGLECPEWYALLLISASGGIILASAEDLIVSFLGLEILSIAVYVLASLHLRRSDSQEAGFKYFILGALSSAFFLYGIALVYGATGSTTMNGIARSMEGVNAAGLSPAKNSSMIMVGLAMLLVGFGFKVSAFPLHIWTPDVYQGSPTPIVGFMASAVKVAAFGGMMRVFLIAFGGTFASDWRLLVMGMAGLSVLIGSFLAIVQSNIKRTMAFSSIAHAGFMLVGMYAAASPNAAGDSGRRAVLFYLLAYTFMSIGTFAVITVVGRQGDGDHSIEAYRGLAKREPILAAAFAVLLFGQVGAPFTAGFFAKFRVIAAAAQVDEAGGYVLAGVAMLGAAVGAFLYLRVVVAMFLDDTPSVAAGVADAVDAGSDVADDVAVSGESVSGDSVSGDSVLVSERVLVAAGSLDVPPLALGVAVLTAAVTVLLGVFPDLGAGVLAEAAAALNR